MTDALTPDRPSRFRGALLGLAVGDALGTTLEFTRPGGFAPLTDLVGGGPFGLAPGQWTDDTSMALCLAASLVSRGGFDARDQMRRYHAWWRKGYLSATGRCFDIGGTTTQALARFEATGEPLAGSTDPRTAGNGSLMRLAPVPMAKAGSSPNTWFASSAASSGTTHGAPQALDACGAYGVLLAAALTGSPRQQVLAPLPGGPLARVERARTLHPEVHAVLAGSYQTKQPPALRSTGYVVDSLEVALWGLHHHAGFPEGSLAVVNLGGDADTAGAIFGQLAGALVGEQGIPARWRQKIALHDLIVDLADGLEALARGERPAPPPALVELDRAHGLI